MRLGSVFAGVCAFVVSTYVVVMLVSPRQTEVVKPPESAHVVDDFPPLSPNPPHPKAVIDETSYDFGRMEVGEKRSHVFTIRNEGAAPLLIKKGPTTCQCTVSDVDTGELPVGESAKITLAWEPTVQAEQFGKGAEIRTNDPEQRSIQLRIMGMVAPRLLAFPEKTWEAPEVVSGEPTVFSGTIISPVVDEFQVVALESQSPLMTAESLPLDKKELEAKRGLCGYKVRVVLSPDGPVGAFTIPLKIKTDLADRRADATPGQGMEVEVLVTGHRRGPIRIIGGKDWDESTMTVVMGAFDVKKGKTLTLPVFVRGAVAEEFRLTEPPVCDPEVLKVTLTRDENSKGKQARFQLTLEYPPGSPRADRGKDNPGKIRLRTNHPAAPEVELSVFLRAF